MSVHVRPCRCIVLIPPTRSVPTQLTRSLWEVAVMSSPAVEAAVAYAPETTDRTHYTGVMCVNITSAVIVRRVMDIIISCDCLSAALFFFGEGDTESLTRSCKPSSADATGTDVTLFPRWTAPTTAATSATATFPTRLDRCGVFLLWEVRSYGDALPDLG